MSTCCVHLHQEGPEPAEADQEDASEGKEGTSHILKQWRTKTKPSRRTSRSLQMLPTTSPNPRCRQGMARQHTSGTETLVRSVSPPEPRRHSKEDSAQAAIRRPSSPNLEDSEAKGKLVHAVLKASHAAE